MAIDESFEADLTSRLRAIADTSQTFGKNWGAFKQEMGEDVHAPQIEDRYVEPMMRSQLELMDALDALRQAVKRFDQASRDAEADARRNQDTTRGW